MNEQEFDTVLTLILSFLIEYLISYNTYARMNNGSVTNNRLEDYA